jgi:mono/diheme cytochrome c family protein
MGTVTVMVMGMDMGMDLMGDAAGMPEQEDFRMKTSAKWGLWLILGAGLVLPLGAMPGMMGGPMGPPGWMRTHMLAFRAMPASYRRLRNPLKPTPERVAEGGALYQQYCAVCHGPEGLGDGPGGKTLNPPPAPLARILAMPMTTDGYVFWRINEGGQVLGSAMPAWKGVLKDEQIWKIVLYMRAGFPPLNTDSSETSQGGGS